MVEQFPSYSLVIPTFRRPAGLAQVLNSVLDLNYPASRLEVVIVDDEGAGRAAAVVKESDISALSVKVESIPRLGVSSARNRGAELSSGQMLLFLDDDMIIQPDDLARRARTLASYPRALLSGRATFPPTAVAALKNSRFGPFRLQLEEDMFKTRLSLETRTVWLWCERSRLATWR